jgi:hypothetical protein
MYGKSATKDSVQERERLKSLKREQISRLLANKFRNKYDVNPLKEPKVDLII